MSTRAGGTSEPATAYTDALARHGTARDEAQRRSVRLSNVRVVTFLAAAAAFLAFDVLEPPGAWIALTLGLLLASVFVGQVVVHRRVRRVVRWEAALADVAQQGLLRLRRDWAGLEESLPAAERPFDEPSADHPYARDLGVTGRASLTRLLGPVTSERGRALLKGWLLEGVRPEVATNRHGAVTELSAQRELRATFTVSGRLHGPDTLDGLDVFFGWAEGDPWTASRPGLRLAAWALPPVLLTGLVGYFAFAFPPWWILPALAQIVVLRRIKPLTSDVFERAEPGGPPLKGVVPQLHLLADRSWSDPLLDSISDRLGRGDATAHRHLERLSRLLDTVASRRNMFYAGLAPFLLLDYHLCVRLDRWRATHGHAVRDWLEALGEWEALSALSALAHDHPDWTKPTFVVDGPPEMTATAIGHPLIPDAECVRNDVSVGPPGTFLFVTGSNMSGKSTLLRALGANAVLAGAGAPVCAATLSLTPTRVYTSMRIEDSLTEGISLFMAELLRIKEIVDAANRTGPAVLYLLDEILHGTNTAERQIAARGVVRHLLASGAIGAVSTHDLTLADAPDLAAAADAVHFREQVVREGDAQRRTTLTFDYKLREGVATTRNALKLLDAVGLSGLELEQPGEE